MNVHPDGANPFVFQVGSSNRPDVLHRVDLTENSGIGKCSCEHFEFRIQPAIDQGGHRTGHPVRCRHIVAARDACLDNVIQRWMAAQDEVVEAGPIEGEGCNHPSGTITTDGICLECGAFRWEGTWHTDNALKIRIDTWLRLPMGEAKAVALREIRDRLEQLVPEKFNHTTVES